MAHFAEINENSIVQRIVVINNLEVFDMENKTECEERGIAYCKNYFGDDTRWVQTSYNGNMRYNYAGPGYKYDKDVDAFIPSKPYNSWILNTETYRWDPPIPKPEDESKIYVWDEETLSWKTN